MDRAVFTVHVSSCNYTSQYSAVAECAPFRAPLHYRKLIPRDAMKADEEVTNIRTTSHLRSQLTMSERLQKGQELLEEGRVEEAVAFFSNELTSVTDPHQASQLHLNLGIAYFLFLQDLQRAIPHFDESIRLFPDNTDSIYNRASANIQLGKFPEAVLDLDRWIQLSAPEEDAEAYQLRGFALLQTGDHANALINFDRALTLDPTNYMALNNRANIYNDVHHRHDAALADLDAAIAAEPAEFLAYKNRGCVRALTNDRDGAMDDFRRCVQIEPESEGEIRELMEDLETQGESKKKRNR
ncbi:hypothetical protein PROFUN_06907 [Planoprotostelium fungivorum]|uniref:Uncharacterized protein n=1 Tax=Planoprotostelium fungivorum TaxID=1890364 RepID=A0A2P6NMW2_9EUKA|nr:hypothetical protein PROFUN_06907 [Planoprotostelium fungivorum]